MHDKMKNYHHLHSNMKKRIETDKNHHQNKLKLNDNTSDAVEYVFSKHSDNSVKKKQKKKNKESQTVESESSSNEDTTPIKQLLKKSNNKGKQSDDDLTPISQLFKETKTTPKKNYLQNKIRGIIKR